jgi:hypothetical protein
VPDSVDFSSLSAARASKCQKYLPVDYFIDHFFMLKASVAQKAQIRLIFLLSKLRECRMN